MTIQCFKQAGGKTLLVVTLSYCDFLIPSINFLPLQKSFTYLSQYIFYFCAFLLLAHIRSLSKSEAILIILAQLIYIIRNSFLMLLCSDLHGQEPLQISVLDCQIF